MTVELPDDLLEEAKKAAQAGGFESTEALIRLALREKLRDIQREFVHSVVERVKQGLAEQGHTPDEILEEFERFRHDASSG